MLSFRCRLHRSSQLLPFPQLNGISLANSALLDTAEQHIPPQPQQANQRRKNQGHDSDRNYRPSRRTSAFEAVRRLCGRIRNPHTQMLRGQQLMPGQVRVCNRSTKTFEFYVQQRQRVKVGVRGSEGEAGVSAGKVSLMKDVVSIQCGV